MPSCFFIAFKYALRAGEDLYEPNDKSNSWTIIFLSLNLIDDFSSFAYLIILGKAFIKYK